MKEKLVSIQKAMEISGLSRTTLWRLEKSGKIRSTMWNRKKMYFLSDVTPEVEIEKKNIVLVRASGS